MKPGVDLEGNYMNDNIKRTYLDLIIQYLSITNALLIRIAAQTAKTDDELKTILKLQESAHKIGELYNFLLDQWKEGDTT